MGTLKIFIQFLCQSFHLKWNRESFLVFTLLIGFSSAGCLNLESWIRNKNNQSSYEPPTLSYVLPTSWYYKNIAINVVTPTAAPSTPLQYSVSPALPTGLNLDTSTGVISGTPTFKTIRQNYTITATDGISSAQAIINFGVGLQFTVNNNADTSDINVGDESCIDGSANCTVRAAMEEAIALTGHKVLINVPAMTVTLSTSAQISVGAGVIVELKGASSATSIIQGNGSPNRLFNLTSVTEFIVDGLSLNLGIVQGASVLGAGISATSSNIILKNCIMNGNENQGTSASRGGAIYMNSGTLTVNNCTFSSNINNAGGSSGQRGGAIAIVNASFSISDSSFTSNNSDSGGAIYTQTATGILSGCAFTANTSLGSGFEEGGAIYSFGIDTLEIEKSTFTLNSTQDSGGAIISKNNASVLTIRSSVFNQNSTLVGNGGAVFLTMGNVVINSTFYNNGAPIGRGQIRGDNLTLRNITVVSSDGSHPAIEDISGFTVYNSIFSVSGAACAGTGVFVSAYNIENGNTCGFVGTGDSVNTDPLVVVGPPASNGGPTDSILLQSLSPARNFIPAGSCIETTDQRNLVRPGSTAGDALCDAGSLEMQNGE